jgi:putative transposase
VKYAFMAQHRTIWPVRWMCDALMVSPSGFYEWMCRPESGRAQANRLVLTKIRESFEDSDRTYGSPRVWRDLHDWGIACSENRTARLMRRAGLIARPRRKRLPFDVGTRSVVAPNILDRQFEASAPNQKWVADFTYIWTGEGWLYVAVVLDLYSRMIVGWSMQARMTSQLVADAMIMAIWRRRPKDAALLHHSDQGSQYTSESFHRLLADTASNAA